MNKITGADAPACSDEGKTAEKTEEKTEERPGTRRPRSKSPAKRQFCDDCQCVVEDLDVLQHYRKHHRLRLVEAAG